MLILFSTPSNPFMEEKKRFDIPSFEHMRLWTQKCRGSKKITYDQNCLVYQNYSRLQWGHNEAIIIGVKVCTFQHTTRILVSKNLPHRHQNFNPKKILVLGGYHKMKYSALFKAFLC